MRTKFLIFTPSTLWLLILMVLLTACSSQKTIVHNLDERDANDIIVFLDNKGITAYKIRSTDTKEVMWDIAVVPDDATQAMAILNAAGLPRRQGQNLLNIFEKSGLVPSEMEEKIRYQAGLAAQIASTIRKIDGVLDADIQLSIPEEDPLNPDKPKGDVTASVYVKHTGVLDDPNTQLIPKIRRLVSSSIQGLKFDNVTIIPDKSRFADLSLRQTITRKGEKEWVRVWTLTIARESTGRFQFLFFTFIIIIILLILVLGWMVWKLFPLFPSGVGVKRYFDFKPFRPTEEEVDEEEEEEEEEGDEEDEEEEEEIDLEEEEEEGQKEVT